MAVRFLFGPIRGLLRRSAGEDGMIRAVHRKDEIDSVPDGGAREIDRIPHGRRDQHGFTSMTVEPCPVQLSWGSGQRNLKHPAHASSSSFLTLSARLEAAKGLVIS
jgi:hypothetical protein